MIQSKEDYKYYLACDKLALRKTTKRPRFKHDIIWTFQRLMRKCEYYENCKKGLFWKLLTKYHKFRYICLSHKLGFSIGFNTCGPGLCIEHYGLIGIHQNARIGANCRFTVGVLIVAGESEYDAPVIGNNVFIGAGAIIAGKVTIADGVVIGVNAAVVKDVLEPNISIAGVPAKKVSNNDSSKLLVKATEIIKKSYVE